MWVCKLSLAAVTMCVSKLILVEGIKCVSKLLVSYYLSYSPAVWGHSSVTQHWGVGG